ncbi:Maf family nucleotide pyrophosphatase [Acinetobacter portensis]|uniref:Nucleoside triphosphate pyrophosphatase n=1 Tax=Acinetobacter portensis TaxID=1839785 RepID=A0ABY4JY46_9GAMM|nr:MULTISPECIES: Maf family protein [Acinetobacter]MCK7609929.1 Maf family nucleotide pyrophosphatase [Acinetobacter portensis]MCK7640704.1 Maf family nucleotide pyrophosphatase [Acinetobacter portensis]MDY6510935.1 Maf family protein [Acinetobacter faecalis]MDY6537418.1 Maf family protein [Acinetobacter faecalis]UPO24356.1 Maf family nucleotide pyrophosphatase [Acinetobacter portensis]
MNNMQLILASSSQTRKELMDRLRIDYQSIVPDIDESPRGENHADDLAKRLAFEKAKFISDQHPNAIVIGSDQVAWREGAPDIFMGKPLSNEKAIKQLQANSDKIVYFSTALSVQHKASGFERTLVEHYKVKFRKLNLEEIERYVEVEQPLHCAGSFKCESLGISLFEEMIGQDQTTLMGMPMIKLCGILRELKILVP